MEKKTTQRTVLEAIINGEPITPAMVDKAKEMLSALDKRNENRSKKSEENRTANRELAEAIAEKMKPDYTYGASELVELMKPDMELNTSKVAAVMEVGKDEGLIEKVEGHKVGGKGRKVMGYKKA